MSDFFVENLKKEIRSLPSFQAFCNHYSVSPQDQAIWFHFFLTQWVQSIEEKKRGDSGLNEQAVVVRRSGPISVGLPTPRFPFLSTVPVQPGARYEQTFNYNQTSFTHVVQQTMNVQQTTRVINTNQLNLNFTLQNLQTQLEVLSRAVIEIRNNTTVYAPSFQLQLTYLLPPLFEIRNQLTFQLEQGNRNSEEILRKVNEILNFLQNTLVNEISLLKEEVSLLKETVNEIHETLESLPDEISEATSLKVVGESYYRYQNIRNFYPTVIFQFLEASSRLRRGHSQIQTRIPFSATEITEVDIQRLTTRIEGLVGLGYNYGSIRATYTQPEKLFKTTMYIKEKSDALETLRRISESVQVNFDASQITFSEAASRIQIARRSENIGAWKAIPKENMEGYYRLSRVVLFVQGMDSPRVLYKE